MANDSAVASGAASGMCANCSQPIKRCSPWGWHHADGPVLCYNESELVATPRTHNPSLQSPEAPIRTGLEDLMRDTVDAMGGMTCKGSYALGSACGKCSRCAEERARFGIPESAVPAKDGFEEWWTSDAPPFRGKKELAFAAWRASLAASAPEGKVTWRVEQRVGRHPDYEWVRVIEGDSEDVFAPYAHGEYTFRLVKIVTTETVVETRTRKEQ